MSAPALNVAHAADLIHRGKVADAEAILRRLVAKRPLDPYAASWLGYALRLLGRSDQAVYFAHLAHQHLPNDPAILAGYAAALQSAGRFEDALKALTAHPLAIDDPHSLPLIECLAQVYASLMIGGECVAMLDRAMAAHQDHARLAPLRAHALLISGRADEAFEEWVRILERPDAVPGALEATISTSLYCSRVDPDTRVSLLNRLGRQVRAHMGPAHAHWNLSRDPARPLHVGMVSADFRNHAMAYFIEPLLEAFNRDDWRVTLYSTSRTIDHVTERLRAYHGVSYVSLVQLTQRAAADRLRAEKVDVLIDFAGHTTGNVLQMLALKPAPVQITAIGFPLSTGIDTVDYRLVDSITDPPSSERFSTESLMRLDPCFLTYAPHAKAPALSPPPSASAPGITFGSFAALQKVTEQTISLWASVLKAVPVSTLLYRSHATRSSLARDDLYARFARAGIAPDRLLIEPPAVDAAALLPEYRRVDIALDSFPYHGTTTTCEATWMGVPTITLEGPASVSRVGCSILSAVGVPDLIARSPDQYAAIAASLAADAPRLSRFRSDTPAGLRRMMIASPLCDTPAQLRRWHALVREAWSRWCSSSPMPNVCNNPA